MDILEYLIRNRKERVEFNQEGYFSIRKLVNEMSRLGYDEGDAHSAILKFIKKGLIEPESLVETELTMDEPVCAHASGYVHSRLLLRQIEYLIGSTTALNTASRDVSTDIGNIWANWDPRHEMAWANKVRILEKLRDYLRLEYQRRCRRHAFYQEYGYGGKHLLQLMENAHAYMDGRMRNPQQEQRAYVPARQHWYDKKSSRARS